jgi:hypothetical protein
MKTRDEILDEIIQWWLSRSIVGDDQAEIKFDRTNTRVTTVRLSQKMFIDATNLAKTNNTTLNRLIEKLLFDALGCPGEYLKLPLKSSKLPQHDE